MMKRHLAAVAAIAAIASLGGVASADAKTTAKNQGHVLGPVVLNEDGTASVTARYICSGGDHLWVSAKQSESGRPDPRLREEGSSEFAAGWMQSHPDPSEFTCDGKWHTGTFTIETTNFGPGATWDPLKRGQAWVQFCVTRGEELLISASRWAAVR